MGDGRTFVGGPLTRDGTRCVSEDRGRKTISLALSPTRGVWSVSMYLRMGCMLERLLGTHFTCSHPIVFPCIIPRPALQLTRMTSGPAVSNGGGGYAHLIDTSRPWWKNSRRLTVF